MAGEERHEYEITQDIVGRGKVSCLVTSFPYRGPDGKIAGIIESFTNITERKQLQEQLFHAQKIHSVGRLAGGIAHDFNNLLTGIRGYTQLVQNRIESESSEYQDLTRVIELVDRAATLTRQLLAFSRRQPLEPVIISINGIVENAMRMIERLIGEDIDLRFVPEATSVTVRVDIGQIEQVLMNLAVNARDAMPDGGQLTIETRCVELTPEHARRGNDIKSGDYVMLAVSDSGCGMDTKTLQHIFDPFFTTKAPGKGTGLGMAIVKNVVEAHGGEIKVETKLGKGSTFELIFNALKVSDIDSMEI